MIIDFEFNTEHGVFRDSIHLPENHGLSDVEIDLIKQERLSSWLLLLNPPEQVDTNG